MPSSAGPSMAASVDALAVNTTTEKQLKNKPKYTKFRQQKLPAWQPILTASTVIPAFVAVGVLFIPTGVILLHASNGVIEHQINYTDCMSSSSLAASLCSRPIFFLLLALSQNQEIKCADMVAANPTKPCKCSLSVVIPDNMTGDVFFYYGLTNFYQNHRRYVKSRSDKQLLGHLDATGSCEPFAEDNGTVFAPCGAIANSKFNDTFKLIRNGAADAVPLTHEGVAWPVDREKKFKNPADMSEFNKYAKPPSWPLPANELDLEDPANNGLQNVDLMVWMRTAALPTFRKLWRRLNTSQPEYSQGLPKGNYTLHIDYSFPVKSFSGEKRFIISTVSWIGSKNNFLGLAYIVVGSFCLALAVVFGVIHWKFGHSLADMSAVQGRSM